MRVLHVPNELELCQRHVVIQTVRGVKTKNCLTWWHCLASHDEGSPSSREGGDSEGGGLRVATTRRALLALLMVLAGIPILVRAPSAAQPQERRSQPHPTSERSHFELGELLVLPELRFPLLLRPRGFHLLHQVPVDHGKAGLCQPASRQGSLPKHYVTDSHWL